MLIAMLLALVPLPATGLPPGALDRLGSPALRHGSAVAAVAFSSDGKLLASGSNTNYGGGDPAVRVWDAATGGLVMGVKHDSTAVAFSSGGARLASAARDGTVTVWDVPAGREVVTVRATGGWAVGVAISPDGTRLASIHGNRRALLVWDIATGNRLHELIPAKEQRQLASRDLTSVAFTPDGNAIAAGVPGVGLVIWDAATGAEVRVIDAAFAAQGWHDDSPVLFTKDGSTVALPGENGMTVCDPAAGAVKRSMRGTRAEDPTRMRTDPLAMTADGRVIALKRNGDLKLWDAVADMELRVVAGRPPAYGHRVALSPDGTRLAYTNPGGVVLEDAATGRRLHADGAHDGGVAVGFGPGGEMLTRDGKNLRVWDAPAGKRRGEVVKVAEGAVAFSPDYKTAVHGGFSYGRTPRLTDAGAGSDKVALDVDKNEGLLYAVFHPDGKRLVTVDTGWHTLSVWDMATGKRLHKLPGHADPIDAVAISPDGKRAITGGGPRAYMRAMPKGYVADTGLRVWDIDAGKELTQFPGRADRLAFSPDGKILAVGLDSGFESSLRLLDAATGTELRKVGPMRLGPASLAFSPDGRRIATGSRDKAVRLWDVATGAELRRLDGHEGEVYSLAWSADGTRLLSGGGEGVAYLWDVTPTAPKAVEVPKP